MKYRFPVLILLLSAVLLMGLQSVRAQDATIEVTGSIEAIGDGTITVNGLVIDLSSIDEGIIAQLAPNATISVTGSLQNGVVIAINIEIISLPEPEPEPTDGLLLNGFLVSYGGRVYEAGSNQTMFTYIVTGTGTPPDLSHFDLSIPICSPQLIVEAYSPTSAVSFGTDPTTGVNGIKWDLPLKVNETRTYTISFRGNVPEGSITAAVKGGPGFQAGAVPGAACPTASVDIEKYISVDGGTTWHDADDAPGPDVEPGAQVLFRFVITNTGQTDLTDFILTDDVFDSVACAMPASLAPGAMSECAIGPFDAIAGQHTNFATVVAVASSGDDGGSIEVRDTDSANYFGGDRPSLHITKYVSADGSSWEDANSTPGLEVEPGSDVFFRFVVTNDGNVPLSGITLNDSSFDMEACGIAETLEPGASSECMLGPFPAEEGQHTNTVTATAVYNEFTVVASDTASYFGGTIDDDDDTGQLPVTIVIEGPVQQVNVNIITIYNIDIEVNVNDPILTAIRIGDNVRVEGNMASGGNTIIIVAINIVIIDVDIVVGDTGTVIWRDSGSGCGNPPPPWAPAHGWRRRCGGNNVIIVPGNSGRGRGRGSSGSS